jgi:hypothetical protein
MIELGDTKLRGEVYGATRSLWLHARGGRSRTEILHLLDAIEQSLSRMHHATYKYRVPCLHCVAAGRTAAEMTIFALEDIEDVTSIGVDVIKCRVDNQDVPIAMLCPDVAMSGIPRLSDQVSAYLNSSLPSSPSSDCDAVGAHHLGVRGERLVCGCVPLLV